MTPSERDTTDEWRIAPGRAPVTVVELEGRIDVALATARSAEEAAMEIGAASLEAAEQARRAAALAERASAAAARAAAEVAAARTAAPTPPASRPDVAPEPAEVEAVPTATNEFVTVAPPERFNGAAARRPDPFDERITAFRQRAEKVMIRLQKLEAGAAPGEGPSEVVRLR